MVSSGWLHLRSLFGEMFFSEVVNNGGYFVISSDVPKHLGSSDVVE